LPVCQKSAERGVINAFRTRGGHRIRTTTTVPSRRVLNAFSITRGGHIGRLREAGPSGTSAQRLSASQTVGTLPLFGVRFI